MEGRVLTSTCLTLLIVVRFVYCVSVVELDCYLKSWQNDLEKGYKARLQAIEMKFNLYLAMPTSQLAETQNEYKSVKETLDSIKGSCQPVGRDKEDSVVTKGIKIQETASHMNAAERLKKTKLVTRVTRPNASIKRQFVVQAESKVTFFATLTGDMKHIGVNQDITFDNTVTNLGSAYNGHHGAFIAPVSGTYVLFTTLHSWTDETYAHFMVNGFILAKIHLKGRESQSSQTIISHLDKGDDVSIQNTDSDKSLAGSHYNTFGGFLLYEDDPAEIVG